MIILGLISIVQVFLPGFILSKLFYDTRLLPKLILSFCVSLLFNYQFVFIATSIGLNSRLSTWALFITELVLLAFIYYKKIHFSMVDESGATPQEFVPGKFQKFRESYGKATQYIFIGLGIMVSLQFAIRILEENPGIFDSWDDVVSWNRWAVDWYNGDFPSRTYHYPQLMPANWSMMYQFIGTNEIQFFAKFIMGLFAAGRLLIFLDLYQRSKSIVFLAALAISGYLIMKVTGNYIGKGFADVPVAFFSLGIFYVFYLGLSGYMSVRLSGVLLACMLSAATLTKQAGFFMILPSLFMLYHLHSKGFLSLRTRALSIMLPVLVFVSLASPWYIYKQIQMTNGVDESEVAWVTQGIHAGKSTSERLLIGTTNFVDAVTEFDFLKSFSESARHRLKARLAISFGLVALLSTWSLYGRGSLFLVVIPYYLIWGWFFSYDLRNSTIILPYLAFSMGIGVMIFLDTASLAFTFMFQGVFRRILFMGVIPLVLLVYLSFKYDSKHLFNKEREKARTLLGDAALNTRLYELYDSNELDKKALSSYVFLKYLPEIKETYVGFDFTKENLDELKDLYRKNKLERTYQYLVLHEAAAPEVWEFIRQKQNEGEVSLNLRSQAGWCIMEMTY